VSAREPWWLPALRWLVDPRPIQVDWANVALFGVLLGIAGWTVSIVAADMGTASRVGSSTSPNAVPTRPPPAPYDGTFTCPATGEILVCSTGGGGAGGPGPSIERPPPVPSVTCRRVLCAEGEMFTVSFPLTRSAAGAQP
jgi:hypothetical protein